MDWTDLHGRLLARAFEDVLGRPENGAVAYVRCLNPDVVEALGADRSVFALDGWEVWRIADAEDAARRTITADIAVEKRENKHGATLLLVDTKLAGAGMDGIYSASREVDEANLFAEAQRLAQREIRSSGHRRYAEHAVKKARGHGGVYAVSPWAEFDFLCRVAAGGESPGTYLYLLGLWPVRDSADADSSGDLNASRDFVDRLLGPGVATLTPAARVDAIRLDRCSERERGDLERFLHEVDTKPLLVALATVAKRQHLWIGALRVAGPVSTIQGVELTSWRNRSGALAKWSGLTPGENGDSPPELILDADAQGDGSTLEVRWKTDPVDLEKNAVEYRIVVLTDNDEELATQTVPHFARKGGESCRFSNDDFSLGDDALLSAKVVISVDGEDKIELQESDEFIIRFGEPLERTASGAALTVRAFSEGLVEMESRQAVAAVTADPPVIEDAKGFVVLRTSIARGRRKSFRVSRPALIAQVEQQWFERQGTIGRWVVKTRTAGSRAGAATFIPFENVRGGGWDRVAIASRRMADQFSVTGGAVGQIYDEGAKSFGVVWEYLLAWAALLEAGDPSLALANTVEVQSLSGRTIGLIVLPSHPLRVAWSVAYDNLVLHAAFEQEQRPKAVRDELRGLDGAMFPDFLPHPSGSGAMVFADTLGFHAVAMVPDYDKEPKATVAVLARALVDGESVDSAPTAGQQSAAVLGNEIGRYLDCHETSRLLHIHALRAGDGLTIARALGKVHKRFSLPDEDDENDDSAQLQAAPPLFSLEIYPSEEQQQRGVAGQFIADAQDRRRRGSQGLADEDRWMLESVPFPGGINVPRLRWARKEQQNPSTAAHLAVAFDSFESCVVAESETDTRATRPYHAFGLLSFHERDYSSRPSPHWLSATPKAVRGEKHPARRSHTEMLVRLQDAVRGSVARLLGAEAGRPVLRTEIPHDKADSLRELHRLCDWVVTLDRNAGIEYFDSPQDNPEIYDTYVIDCVPEREDLGCLQLITSTANLEEVRNLLDAALDQMGLSHSRRNAQCLLEHLKALSGRLAIRLTGDKPATSELIALAVSHVNCRSAKADDDCWVSLKDGFIIPVDDVRDLLPPLMASEGEAGEEESAARPDLIYVSLTPRKGLVVRFVEVKYRRHLSSARTPAMLQKIDEQTRALRWRWRQWYGHEDVCSVFRAVRRAKLARVLRFYADKARRHYLPKERYEDLVSEIDRMIEKGGDYAFPTVGDDRGWVFCPEYAGHRPLKISPDDWSTPTYLFGPGLLPDAEPGPVADSRLDPTRDILSDSGRGSDSGAITGSESPLSDSAKPSGTVPLLRTEKGTEGAFVAPQGDNATDEVGEALTSATATPGATPYVCFGTDTLTSADVRWPLTVKGNPHLLIAGLPGMGKTTCLLNLCKQMIAVNVRPIIFSYHQDIDERLEQAMASVRFIDFDGLGFNPLQIVDRQARMAHLDVAGAIRDIFSAIYPELGDIQTDRIRRAIKDSFVEAGWGDTAPRDAKEPSFKRFVEILRDDPKPDHGLRNLLARLGELDDYGFFDLGGSWRSLWGSEQPTVIRIHTTQNENLQRAFASLVFYSLYKDMFRRGIQDRITHAVIFDEAHRAARLKLIPTMAKECRKYGVSLVLASQEAQDFNMSVFSAIANYLILRLTEADAKFLVRNVSNSQQERRLIDTIKQMERFKALYFCEGKSRPIPVRLSP